MKSHDLKFEVRKRLEEIERCLYWKGGVQRSNLIKTFGISPQQASADFALYQNLAPNNAVFNRSLKRYEPSERFQALFFEPDISDYFNWAERLTLVTATIPSPLRPTDPIVLKQIINAIHSEGSVEIEYQSMSSPISSKRRLTPHTLVFDGYRYHVRGYCHLKEDFRDFVLGRIMKAASQSESGQKKDMDEAWNTKIILRLCPHPDLTHGQKKVIERDFGMDNGELQLRVRQAMLVYTLVQLRLDRFTEMRTPAEQQIVLANQEVLGYLEKN